MKRPLMKNREEVLPPKATDILGLWIQRDDFDANLIRQVCDVPSLSDFAWQVFEIWRADGMLTLDAWVFEFLAEFGDDEARLRLVSFIRRWPYEKHGQACWFALDVLARSPSEAVLHELYLLSRWRDFHVTPHWAAHMLEWASKRHGFSADELADRVVPRLGLADDGTRELDFGSRQFRVGFTPLLRPFITDSSGARLKGLPAPTKDDDPKKATEARKTWGRIRYEVGRAASNTISRLDRAMCTERKWRLDTWRFCFIDHPYMVHVARRLVWAAFDREGNLMGTFRVAEDRTLADEMDSDWIPPEGCLISIGHPILLPQSTLGNWSSILGDYAIIQPFPQICRKTYTPTPQEVGSSIIMRFQGRRSPWYRPNALARREWSSDSPIGSYMHTVFTKTLPDGLIVALTIDPGIERGMPHMSGRQVIGTAVLQKQGGTRGNREPVWSDIAPVAFSEVLWDLDTL